MAGEPGVIREFQVLSQAPAYNGATPPDAVGPYEVITGIVHGELDPDSAANARIVNLKNAPVNARGYVEYSTDVVILTPLHPVDGKRVVFYDVVNRGRKYAQDYFIGGKGPLDSGGAPASTFPSLLRDGYTIVWSGWQGDLPQTGKSTIAGSALLGTRFPVATRHDGSPLTGFTREEFVPDFAEGAPTTIALSYPPADANDNASATLSARQSWQVDDARATSRASGNETLTYDAPSVTVHDWKYVRNEQGGYAVTFTPPTAVPGPHGTSVPPDAGTIYSFVYRASQPTVNGIAFAAVRDLISFLRYQPSDEEGNPNPLNGLKQAQCAGAHCANKSANFDVAIGEGISQSGRFMRDFLHLGFNQDVDGKRVFDGIMPIVPAARGTWTNMAFSQPGRWSREHEDHFTPGFQFPFAYNVTTDPVSGQTDGLMQQCLATHTCPKIMQIDGEFEWWGGGASLVVTDGAGKDLTLPPDVRYYLVSGTRHTGDQGVTTGLFTQPGANSVCALPNSPVALRPVVRALIPRMVDWVAQDKTPPPSQYPTVAHATAVAPTVAATGFPDLSDVMVPNGPAAKPLQLHVQFGLVNPVFVTDYSNAAPVVDTAKRYTVLVPKDDRNGNALAGVRVPDLQVPLATYTGWSYRASGHAAGESCLSAGSAIPLAVNDAEKNGGHDTRASLASLYHGRADYVSKVANAAHQLVDDGYLLPADADNLFVANARKVSPALLPSP
ncbi:alpha/beta hydrolase domain-containing protein [Paraburkholderia rhizosphaerae]|nr:alpha/beta hydrolase domain-containing protein [Paraburkholderia rhizosphaerae]